jgi:hypothetical protein
MKRNSVQFNKEAVGTFVLSRWAVKRAAERLKEAAKLFDAAAWCEKHRLEYNNTPDTKAQTARMLINEATEDISIANFLLDDSKIKTVQAPRRDR